MKKSQPCLAIGCSVFLLSTLLLVNYLAAKDQRGGNDKYACSEPNPATMCNASNTCGSASAPCTVDVKRTAYSAAAIPSIPKSKRRRRDATNILPELASQAPSLGCAGQQMQRPS